MVLRQEPTTIHELRVKNIQHGVEFAKEAVSLDTTDGTSWTILGNAYLSSFFTIAQNPLTLRLCMSAYAQAVSTKNHFLCHRESHKQFTRIEVYLLCIVFI